MAYLLINDDENILINKVGESIYMRNYPQKYSQRSSILGKSNYNDYASSIDTDHRLHLIYKTSQNSILHLCSRENGYSTENLLDDADNIYKISNLQIVSEKKSYLFYCALNPYENTNDLIFHNFSDGEGSAPQSLLALQSLTTKYLCTIENGIIYLMCCILQDNNYELNLYPFSISENRWLTYETLVASEYPITDFSFTVNKSTVHVTYVIEKFGHSTLFYGQSQQESFISVEIIALGQRIKPVTFIYNDIIWINYITSQTLYSCFSSNSGHQFSAPIRCTLQSNSIADIVLLGYDKTCLSGHYYFGTLDQQPNIAILSQVDVDHILFYSTPNIEMREMLRGAVTSVSVPPPPKKDVEKLEKEILQLREQQKNITEQYNELANFTKDVQFEGKKWRKKYQKLSKEMKEMKSEQEYRKEDRKESPKDYTQELTENISAESKDPLDLEL